MWRQLKNGGCVDFTCCKMKMFSSWLVTCLKCSFSAIHCKHDSKMSVCCQIMSFESVLVCRQIAVCAPNLSLDQQFSIAVWDVINVPACLLMLDFRCSIRRSSHNGWYVRNKPLMSHWLIRVSMYAIGCPLYYYFFYLFEFVLLGFWRLEANLYPPDEHQCLIQLHIIHH